VHPDDVIGPEQRREAACEVGVDLEIALEGTPVVVDEADAEVQQRP